VNILIANIIDFVAALLQVWTGAMKRKATILAVQIVQMLMQSVSMLLLGGVTGAVSNILSCYRNYLCYKEKLNVFWKGVLIAASVVTTVLLNEQGAWGVVPAVSGIVFILFMDVKDPVKFKLLVTLTSMPWLLYHFVLKAYVGAVCDVTFLITNIITTCVMIKEKKTADA